MRADRWGVGVSALCLAHCLLLPVAAVLLPSVGGLLAAQETLTHWLLLGLAVPISAWAWQRGYRRHRSRIILALGAAGLVLMLIAVSHWFGHEYETPLTLVGVALVALGHLANSRSLHSGHQAPEARSEGGI